MRVDKICKIIYFWLIAVCDFMIGVNVMYCIANPGVGLWRIPFMVIGVLALNVMMFPILTAETVKEKGA